MEPPSRILTAIHEAGHAAMAKACGARVTEISIRVQEEKGNTHFQWAVPYQELSPKQLKTIRRFEAWMAIAGLMAESRLRRHSLERFRDDIPMHECGQSAQDMQSFYSAAGDAEIPRAVLVRGAWSRLEQLWPAVRRIAKRTLRADGLTILGDAADAATAAEVDRLRLSPTPEIHGFSDEDLDRLAASPDAMDWSGDTDSTAHCLDSDCVPEELRERIRHLTPIQAAEVIRVVKQRQPQ